MLLLPSFRNHQIRNTIAIQVIYNDVVGLFAAVNCVGFCIATRSVARNTSPLLVP